MGNLKGQKWNADIWKRKKKKASWFHSVHLSAFWDLLRNPNILHAISKENLAKDNYGNLLTGSVICKLMSSFKPLKLWETHSGAQGVIQRGTIAKIILCIIFIIPIREYMHVLTHWKIWALITDLDLNTYHINLTTIVTYYFIFTFFLW